MKKIYLITLIALCSTFDVIGQWENTNLNEQTYDMTEHDGSLFASANDKGLVKYNGATWDSVGTDDFTLTIATIHIVELASSGSYLYAVVQDQLCADAMVYKSTDGGVTYQVDTAGLPRIPPSTFAGQCAGKLRTIADLYSMDGYLIATISGGAYMKQPTDAEWLPITNAAVKFAEFFGNYNGKWYAYYSNKVHMSSDFGQTWTTPANADRPTFYTSSNMTVNPTSGRIWITGAASIFDGPGLYYSDDLAASWDFVAIKTYLGSSSAFGGTKQHILDMFSIGDTLLLNVTNDALSSPPDMLISYDNGASFSVDTAGLHIDQNGTAASTGMVYFENDYYVAFNYQSVYRKGESVIGLKDNTRNQNLLYAYPNPFSNIVNINGLNSKATLALISSDGKITMLKNNSNSIDLSNFAEGIYYLQITLGDHVELHKLVKQ